MDLLLIVLPAFLIFGTGFIGQKLLKFDIKSISKMSLYLMLPFLTFDTFYTNELNIEYFYMFLFSLLLVLLIIGITNLLGRWMKSDKTELSAMQLGTIFPNSGNYGAPIALFAFGSAGFDYAVIIMVIHALLINTIGIFIASYGSERSTTIRDAFRSVLKMPVIYGVLLGVIFQLAKIELPPTILEGISLVGSASIPTVMLILGMQLAEVKSAKFDLKYVNSVIVVRMIMSPLIAVLLVSFMPVNDLIHKVFILLAAMPIAANTTMLAVQFNVKPDLVSFTTLVTTLISLLTIPITIFFIR
ncbi:AEC family transporter [Bacillus tuaregi]|uniref:AEC family transporter n=1 Tax=Bacillus tuaregi TaxID=1816695 RepID=UPI0008F8B5F9|nr:AEC family transporter [Bacillus tuaregi]